MKKNIIYLGKPCKP